jgi:hypothetical protein
MPRGCPFRRLNANTKTARKSIKKKSVHQDGESESDKVGLGLTGNSISCLKNIIFGIQTEDLDAVILQVIT